MKKQLMIALFGGLILFSACTKDEDDNNDGTTTTPSELVVDGTTYTLGSAFLEHYPDYGVNSNNLDLIMLSDGITVYYDEDNYPDSISGSGYMAYFESFSSDSTYLSNGTYTADTTLTVNTFATAWVAPVSNGEVNQTDQIMSGSFTVNRADNVYTITGSGKDHNSKDFNFSFNGAITVF